MQVNFGQNGFEVAVFKHILHGKSPNIFKEQSNNCLLSLLHNNQDTLIEQSSVIK